MMADVPPVLTPLQVAKACKVTKKKARGWLRRAGALEKQGGAFIAHESVVREKLPDVYQRVYAYFVFGDAAN
jgi:hypothetical protein